MSAPNPGQFAPYFTAEGLRTRAFAARWSGGHNEHGSDYDPNASFPLSVEGAAVTARNKGADSKN